MEVELIRRFEALQVPRYTSYPTSPHFLSLDEGEYRDWLSEIDPTKPVSLYLHVPFCQSLCWYCGCHTMVPSHDDPIDRYAQALRHEIRMVAAALPGRIKVEHLHWGGGTPSMLGPTRFSALVRLLSDVFDFSPSVEHAMEVDPRVLTPAMVAAMAEAGVNRASLGVQSFDPQVQQAINRHQSFPLTRKSVELLRAAGIDDINLDLLFGLPRQTIQSCRETATQALELAPDRLAVFAYAHVPDVKASQNRIDTATLPESVTRHLMSDAIAEVLTAGGFHRIGLDHYAHANDALFTALSTGKMRRNFQGYTTDESSTLIGFGASSIGAVPRGFVQNAPRIGEYLADVMDGHLPIRRGRALSLRDRLRSDIIEQLMCYLAVDLKAVAARHGVDPRAFGHEYAQLAQLAKLGVINFENGRIQIAEDCRLLARIVAAVFDDYLADAPGRHARAI